MEVGQLRGRNLVRVAILEAVEEVFQKTEICLVNGVPVVQQAVVVLFGGVDVVFELLALEFEPSDLLLSGNEVAVPEVELLLGHFFPCLEVSLAPVQSPQWDDVHQQVPIERRVKLVRHELLVILLAFEEQLGVAATDFPALDHWVDRSVDWIDLVRVFLRNVWPVLSLPINRRGRRLLSHFVNTRL